MGNTTPINYYPIDMEAYLKKLELNIHLNINIVNKEPYGFY